MHASDLPEDVLFLVARRVAIDPAPTLAGWASSLGLLAVCARWRRVALPVVYSTLWITYGTTEDMLRLVGAGRTGDKAGDCGLQTNARLVAQAGHAALVRHVRIAVRHIADPSWGLDAAARECAQIMPRWTAVRTLTLHLTSANADDGPGGAGDAQPPCDTVAVAARLADVFPAVVDLRLAGVHASATAAAVCARIAACYAASARRLASQFPMEICRPARFALLETLECVFDEAQRTQPPPASAARLKALRMLGVPLEFGWQAFGDSDREGALVFPQLARLALTYDLPWVDEGRRAEQADQAACGPRLVFPRLELLELLPGSAAPPIFAHGVFPGGIRHLRVNCPLGHIAALVRGAVPRIDFLALAATGNSAGDVAAGLAAISALAAAARVTASAQLTILGPGAFDLPGTAACPSLTHLSVTARTFATTVLRLVRQLPGLASIRLTCVVLDEDDGELAPIASRIEGVTLSFARSEPPGAAHAAFAVRLVARLPAARTLRAVQLPRGPTRAHVDALLAQAPHLADVELELAP